MFRLAWTLLLARRERSAVLLLGLLVVSAAYSLLLSAVETTRVTVDQDIAQHWDTTYHLLIRPVGARSEVERQYSLVQANHLSELSGGISLDEYDAIRTIPGVEVAAPVAMLGYFELYFRAPLEVACEPGFYALENTLGTSDGARPYPATGREYFYCPQAGGDFYHLFDSPYYNIQAAWQGQLLEDPNTRPWFRQTAFALPALLAAVDPEQEDRLVGLKQAMVSGEYLDAAQPGDIPLIFNASSYVSFTLSTTWKRLDLPLSDEALAEAREAGPGYLDGQETETIRTWTFDGQGSYRAAQEDEQALRAFFSLSAIPEGLTYADYVLPPGAIGPVLQARPYKNTPGYHSGWHVTFMPPAQTSPAVLFREPPGAGMGGGLPAFAISGVYDIERLPRPDAAAEVPLETYFPPSALLRFDLDGHTLEPVALKPTFNKLDYLVSPPLALTTLEAAEQLNVLHPGQPISAIRVRVAGVDQYSPEAQQRVEQIAAEIIDRTGLTVDVTVGSSPRRVLVFIPGAGEVPPLGYVEEGWLQMGVSYQIAREVKRANVILFSVVLVVTTLYILNTTLMSMLARARSIALQKALGWPDGAVFTLVLSENVLAGAIAGTLGLSLGWLLVAALGLSLPWQRIVAILPLSLALSTLGSLLPAALAARLSPAAMFAREDLAVALEWRAGRLSVAGYAWRQMLQRPARLLLALATIATAVALGLVFVGAALHTKGYLAGTVLGELILVHISPLHYLLLGVSLLVAALATTDVLLMGVLERRREMGLLKAVGWKNRSVFALILWEATGLGLLGGLVGWGMAAGLLTGLFALPVVAGLSLLPIGVVVPILVASLAAVYPAVQATRVPPAEAMRYE